MLEDLLEEYSDIIKKSLLLLFFRVNLFFIFI